MRGLRGHDRSRRRSAPRASRVGCGNPPGSGAADRAALSGRNAYILTHIFDIRTEDRRREKSVSPVSISFSMVNDAVQYRILMFHAACAITTRPPAPDTQERSRSASTSARHQARHTNNAIRYTAGYGATRGTATARTRGANARTSHRAGTAIDSAASWCVLRGLIHRAVWYRSLHRSAARSDAKSATSRRSP